MMITFDFNGKNYIVITQITNSGLIVLPDGTLLIVDAWKESLPPQPINLRTVDDFPSKGQPQDVIAIDMNAAIAKEGRALLQGEFKYLQPGDKVFYAAGRGNSRVIAEAVIASKPSVSVSIRIIEIHFMGPKVISSNLVGDVPAAASELWRLQ